MKYGSLFVLLCVGACASGGSPVTMSSFYEIPIGATQEEVASLVGKPYSTRTLPDGSVEYEYIERFKAGGRDINERHYYLVVKDGKVVSKSVDQRSPLPYGFDSYEMQTSQGEGDSSPD